MMIMRAAAAGAAMFWRLSSVKALVYDVPVTNENSKAKPIAAHLKSCGIWEKFGRAVEKNSKQIYHDSGRFCAVSTRARGGGQV
jgi:hypothetical protein